MPGDDPELVPRIPVNRVRLAKPPEERVRVPDRVGGEQVIQVSVVEYLCHAEMRTRDIGTSGLGREAISAEGPYSPVIASRPSPDVPMSRLFSL